MATGPDNARLQVAGLCRDFAGRRVVDEVSFSVRPAEVACLLGPSGCGKSTTLRLVAGVDRQDAGAVQVDGQVISDDATHMPPERRAIGMMFQDFALFPHLTVAENVAFGLPGGVRRNATRVADLLARVRLERHARAYPHALSGGEQQRVALARALAPRPGILLMDEPFSGLDERLRDGIRDETLALLKDEGTAVLLVTHDPQEAMRMADQILLMRGGRIVQRGAPYNIYNAPVDRQAAAFFSDVNVLAGQSRGALTETAFGEFLTPGLPDGTPVEIVVRPQHVHIDFDRNGNGPTPTAETGMGARARVLRARFMGRESLVEFQLEQGGARINAVLPGVFLPKPDTRMWLTLRRDRVFVFPRGEAAVMSARTAAE